MVDLLNKYFALTGQLSLPGIGRFYRGKISANSDFLNGVINSPELTVHYSEETAPPEKKFYEYIARENNSDEKGAIRMFQDFTDDLCSKLKARKTVNLPGIGNLEQNHAGVIYFTGVESVQQYFPQVTATRVIREDASHDILVGDNTRTNIQMQEMYEPEEDVKIQKDYWWVYAIVLGVLALAAVAIYYFKHGNFR